MFNRELGKPTSLVWPYVAAVTLCLLILAWTMKLWHLDLSIPLGYSGDCLFNSLQIKGIIENGWYLYNPSVGLPDGLDFRDFPSADLLHYLIIKLLSCFTADYAVILNLLFLLSFPLTTVTGLYTLRQFKLSWPIAVVGSLLFTFLPYHFMRGVHHLYLASYYLVPLAVLLMLWIYRGYPKGKAIFSMLICLLLASAGVYYAFFTCFLLIVAGLTASLTQKNLKCLAAAGRLITVIVLGVLLNVAPTLLKINTDGLNADVGIRVAEESEVYALKITELLLPVSGHRLAFFEHAKNLYQSSAPLVNENVTASLGVIGSIGFLLLLGGLFYKAPVTVQPNLFRSLSELNIAAVLLGTMGGFGTLFNYAVTPQIRCYNRISVFIAFFAIFAFCLLLEGLGKWKFMTIYNQLSYYGILVLILSIGILDQTTEQFIPAFSETKAEYLSDATFVQQIETAVPKGAMIFQLPYVPFPENPPINKMRDYDLLRGYLHSDNLRWSYPAMKGREAAVWQREAAAKPVNELVEELARAGYSGIYLDRYGYPDSASALEKELSQVTGTKPLVSENSRLAFYNLSRVGHPAYEQ